MVHLVVLVFVGSVGARKVGISFKSLLSIGIPGVGNTRVRISSICSLSVVISIVGSLGVEISKSSIQSTWTKVRKKIKDAVKVD